MNNLPYSHSYLLEQVFNHSRLNPAKTAIINGEQEVTYGELQKRILSDTEYLMQLNTRIGDKIVIYAQKSINFMSLYLAAHLLGVTTIIVGKNYEDEKINYIIKSTTPKIIITNSDERQSYEIAPNWHDTHSVNASSTGDITPDMTADIMFTSGSTGRPKGVCLSHKNITASIKQINGVIKTDACDVELLALPIHHSFGLGRMRCVLSAGGTLVLLENFSNVKRFFSFIDKYKVTGFGMVPAAWAYINRFSKNYIAKFANQLKYIEIGSAPMPLSDKLNLIEYLPSTKIFMHFGLTEASRSFFTEFHEMKDHLDSIGYPCNGIDIQIRKQDGTECRDGEAGEICIKGEHVTKSYLAPEDNITAFYGEYFRSGDIGIKKNGLYYLIGREKEVINIGGKKISPLEVEDAAKKCGIKECACIPIKDPDGILGEVPKLFIVKDPVSKDISFDELVERLRQYLETFKIPKEYEWIDKIPKTESGKIQRLLLRGNEGIACNNIDGDSWG